MHPRHSTILALGILSASSAGAAVPPEACVGQIQLQMQTERTGHASVRLTVNGVEARLLVDTGANVNTLDTTEGRRAKPVVVASSESQPGEGRANMTLAYGAIPLGTQQFSVMDLGFINVSSARYGTEPFMGQLGASFFTEYKARLDFERMTLCLTVPKGER